MEERAAVPATSLRELKREGFGIAIDDMGAGYSSLQSLVELEPDYLKFDISLVRHIDRNLIKRSLLETLVELSEKIGAQRDRRGHRGGGGAADAARAWACPWARDATWPPPVAGPAGRRGGADERADPRLPRAPRRSWPRELAERGSLGVIVLDASPLGAIEDEYGSDAYEEVRQRIFKILARAAGQGLPQRRHAGARPAARPALPAVPGPQAAAQRCPPSAADLKAVRSRACWPSLVPSLGRAAFPYLKTPPRIEVGYGMAVLQPAGAPGAHRARAPCRDALRHGRATSAQADELLVRERLLDLILRERIVTAYQPIMDLQGPHGAGLRGALARRRAASGLEAADALFGAAERRTTCWSSWTGCAASAPCSPRAASRPTPRSSSTRCPRPSATRSSAARPLIDFLDRAQVSPDRIVIEITEKLVIDNYDLFREAMAYFTDLGMSFAVDDVGAGYSGLESIARLKPHVPEDRHRAGARRARRAW